ncbi:hypothetical protein [Algoriphagus zhangzhouensis]|uniref:WD40-like Beta Propeller Repeat n=1 Tax=Algoriphagus zhangzhouensis TaxID=1073327 RepID=A0A1M7Z5D0_9BACT|nr:hypothetical protein [Algoriphagus zhangzhouensis]TDY48877.1 hypothetical protein A8938_0566 [Algoriphagus zhangzhouensis]SHO60091.1 hypothetical protein SAMN04488108_0566 [Algoriphagus zhangzhouensis]
MNNKILACTLSLFLGAFVAQAQTSTDLWEIKTKGKGKSLQLVSGSEKAITDRVEYDNQPSFINEYQMVFSAADDKGNHDIIVYNFESGKFTNLTKTADRSEYSPRITECGQYIAAVVMEPDQKQRLWLYPTNFGEPELLYDDIEPVGYYDWYDNKAAMFVLGEPHELIYARGRNDLVEMDEAIGRSIVRRPKTNQITYLSTENSAELPDGKAFEMYAYDLETMVKADLGLSLAGSQDFIWLDKNTLLMGRGNSLYIRKWNEKNWELLGTLESDTHHGITRLAYSLDLDVIVVAMERNQQ